MILLGEAKYIHTYTPDQHVIVGTHQELNSYIYNCRGGIFTLV